MIQVNPTMLITIEIIKGIVSHRDNLKNHPDSLKFLAKYMEGERLRIITYNEIVDHLIERGDDNEDKNDDKFKFKDIIGHQGPMKPG